MYFRTYLLYTPHRIYRIWEREENIHCPENDGSASIGYVPPLPAIWSTMTTTASAFPISPKDMVREYMSSENVRLVTAPVTINETGCTHCILSRYKSPSTMIKVCTCDSKRMSDICQNKAVKALVSQVP